MNRVEVCMIGCGVMGKRHVSGYAALNRSGRSNIELVGVCDLKPEAAAEAADMAERLIGRRPATYHSVDEAIQASTAQAYDVVTEVRSHLPIVMALLRSGKHVLCEKPLGLTVRSCIRMMEESQRRGAVLAIAENFRRDPPNRLVNAILQQGILEDVFLMRQAILGGNNQIVVTPWRHHKETGAIGLDMGVHLTDLVQYFFGPYATAFGKGFIAEPFRYRPGTEEASEDPVTATGEDSFIASYEMESGVLVQSAFISSGLGRLYRERTIHGRLGSIEIFEERSGRSPILHHKGGSISGDHLESMVAFVPDEMTRILFGGKASYEMSFAEADAALVALELFDFGQAVSNGSAPEVDGFLGMTAVAAVLAVYESGLLGQKVLMNDVLSGACSTYQDEIDAASSM